MNITENVNKYMSTRGGEERYASFDYCYNYFQSFRESGRTKELASDEILQMSCLQLGFYLASWGMLRGSSFLLQKSAKHYARLIKAISQMGPEYWSIDVDTYSDHSIRLLMELRREILGCLGDDNHYATVTLITKIMLGVFGCIPAYDQYFCRAFRIAGGYLSEGSLKRLHSYYCENKAEIDGIRIETLDFLTGVGTNRLYPKAKIIDMVGYAQYVGPEREG